MPGETTVIVCRNQQPLCCNSSLYSDTHILCSALNNSHGSLHVHAIQVWKLDLSYLLHSQVREITVGSHCPVG